MAGSGSPGAGPGQRRSFETTVAVDDVDKVVAAVSGRRTILMAKTTISGVGDCVFADPSGTSAARCATTSDG
jgi:hypothetical protein